MDYIKIEFSISPYQPWSEILANDLVGIGFDSFTEENEKLQAYIPSVDFQSATLDEQLERYSDIEISFTKEEIPSQNWNAIWESDFQPVEVNNDLIIYAPFHDLDVTKYKNAVEIQPQMSFGTGHHQTTFLLSKTLLSYDLTDKTVLDVGTGTGILGILSSKLGAKKVFGTDIESGACENAIENINRNNIENFSIELGDINVIPYEKYDVIIANINKNVLKSHFQGYAERSKPGTLLMLSGFFEADVSELEIEAKKSNFILDQVLTFETWAVMLLIKH